MSRKEKVYHALCILFSVLVAVVLVHWAIQWRKGAFGGAPMITIVNLVVFLAILIPSIVALARKSLTLLGTIFQLIFLFMYFPFGLPIAILGIVVLRADLKQQKDANKASQVTSQ